MRKIRYSSPDDLDSESLRNELETSSWQLGCVAWAMRAAVHFADSTNSQDVERLATTMDMLSQTIDDIAADVGEVYEHSVIAAKRAS